MQPTQDGLVLDDFRVVLSVSRRRHEVLELIEVVDAAGALSLSTVLDLFRQEYLVE